MASIVREVVIQAPAEPCWAALRAFDALHERLAPGFITSLEMLNERDRRITFFMGAVVTERLVGVDDRAMRLAYTVIDGPLNAAHYNAVAQVVRYGPGACRFTWAVDVLPDELGDRVAELMDAGLRAISATLGALGAPDQAVGR